MTQGHRIPGGLIDRSRTLRFRFDGREYAGHPGDTLASALLANGVRLMGRSFKYHRPRGPLTAGSEEPNALVELRTGARREPNTRATLAELFDGLEARSQNRLGPLGFDLMAVNDLLSPFLGAGFYYKTFMWPRSFWERVYEPAIRRAAGLGRAAGLPDPDGYDRGFLHCDLLVVGAGPAGLAAALTAGRAGARVILADEDFQAGGRLNAETRLLETPAAEWIAATLAELASLPRVRVMGRTTVLAALDHGVFTAVERVADHLPAPPEGKPRQTLWTLRARRAILCTGATERPIAFRDNDRPGIMTASALRAWANRWAVLVDRRVAVFANNDDGHRTARDLARAGAEVTLIDPRPDAAKVPGVEQFNGAVVIGTSGRLGLRAVALRLASGEHRRIACGALGVAGGWNPNLQLASHHRNRPAWSEGIAAFVAGPDTAPGIALAGAAAGDFSTAGALGGGARAACEALGDLGLRAGVPDLPPAEDAPTRIAALWHVPGKGRAWLDLQNDVTVKDVKLAHQENFRSVEHLKRYTTLGMATDQGKTSNVAALAIMSELTGRPIPQTGTTIYRPPYVPVALGALAGGARGPHFRPTRLTPSHDWATERGAVFVEAGAWLRAQYYPLPHEAGWQQSAEREALAVRAAVGICDVTTLGKIEVQGTDAGAFLDRIYCNTISTLAVGRTRYGLMLREDGFVADDGTAARLAPDRFVVSTTTANAAEVMRHMEFCRQCLWPDLDVQLVSATDAWAQFAVAGPRSRDLMRRIVDPGQDLSNEAFPFMACAELTVCGGTRARLFRISFSGELGYEIAVPARYGDALVRRLMEVGADLGVTPYGTEALAILRIEKGHAAGGELTGQTTAANLGLGRMVSARKDAIGTTLARRAWLVREDDHRLVGLEAVEPQSPIRGGAHLVAREAAAVLAEDQGWITSACRSPHLNRHIGLAMLVRGDRRHGEILRQVNPLEGQESLVRVVSPHFIDPEGERLRG